MLVIRIAAMRHGLLRSYTLSPTTWRSGSRHRRHVRGTVRNLNSAPLWMPPLIFSGLLVGLWTWKCMMMVAFQNMIIYNPFLPPNSRSMRIAEFQKQCGGIEWREMRIKSLDDTEIALCIADGMSSKLPKDAVPKKSVYILYFQGPIDCLSTSPQIV